MEQLYFTSCRTGASINGQSGFQIRALSKGLKSASATVIGPHVGYSLPYGTKIDSSTRIRDLPIRLAYLSDIDGNRIVVHTVYVPFDVGSGRPHSYFTHILSDLPEEIDAAVISASWGSASYKTKDDEGPIELPTLSAWPISRELTEDKISCFISEHRNFAIIAASFQSVLEIIDQGENVTDFIILALPSEIVAHVCLTIARLLPLHYRHYFTFSTYEPDGRMLAAPQIDGRNLLFSAILIGRIPGPKEQNSVPSDVRQLAKLVIDDNWKPTSELKNYVTDMLAYAKDGQWQKIDNVLQFCNNANCNTIEELNAVFRWQANGVTALTSVPTLAAKSIQEPQVVRNLSSKSCLDLLYVVVSEKQGYRVPAKVQPMEQASGFTDWMAQLNDKLDIEVFQAMLCGWLRMTGAPEDAITDSLFKELPYESWLKFNPNIRKALISKWLEQDCSPTLQEISDRFLPAPDLVTTLNLREHHTVGLMLAGIKGNNCKDYLECVAKNCNTLPLISHTLANDHPDLLKALASNFINLQAPEQIAYYFSQLPIGLQHALVSSTELESLAELDTSNLVELCFSMGWYSVNALASERLRQKMLTALKENLGYMVASNPNADEFISLAILDPNLPTHLRSLFITALSISAVMKENFDSASDVFDSVKLLEKLPEKAQTELKIQLHRYFAEQFIKLGKRSVIEAAILVFATGEDEISIGDSFDITLDTVSQYITNGVECHVQALPTLFSIGLGGLSVSIKSYTNNLDMKWTPEARLLKLELLWNSLTRLQQHVIDDSMNSLANDDLIGPLWLELRKRLPKRSYLSESMLLLRNSLRSSLP